MQTVVDDKFLAINKPVWVINLILPKAFDRVDWNESWVALVDEGISEHIAYIMHRPYFNQRGWVRGKRAVSEHFPINARVRQGCVVSRLFIGGLE